MRRAAVRAQLLAVGDPVQVQRSRLRAELQALSQPQDGPLSSLEKILFVAAKCGQKSKD